jgi:hypothetical protein
MSVTEITTTAGWLVGLAIVACLAAGWRKPARATANPWRARGPFRPVVGTQLDELRVPMINKRTPWWRRLFSLAMIPSMAVVLGAAVATIVGFGVAWVIITLSDMLRR